jgi:hypothetical protein
MSLYNMAAIEKGGLLSEKDYKQATKSLVKSLSVPDFRVQMIRCALIWEPIEFEKYEIEALENFDRKHRPVPDPDMAFEFETIPMTLQAKFDIAYFPDLYREYELPGFLDKLLCEKGEDGFVVLSPSYFRSVVLASYQVEQECKQRYLKTTVAKELSKSVEIECQFLAPAKLTPNYGDHLTARVTFFVLPE